MDKRGVGVNNDAKNKRKGNQQGQYSAILTKQACWTRREILSGQDRPIVPSRVANQKAGFASNPSIYETRQHHKILFSTLIVLVEFFNPVIPMAIFGIPPFAHSSNPESRPVFAIKSGIPSFKNGNRGTRKT